MDLVLKDIENIKIENWMSCDRNVGCCKHKPIEQHIYDVYIPWNIVSDKVKRTNLKGLWIHHYFCNECGNFINWMRSYNNPMQCKCYNEHDCCK